MKQIWFKLPDGQDSFGEIREVEICTDPAWHAAHTQVPHWQIPEIARTLAWILGDSIAVTPTSRAPEGDRVHRCASTVDPFSDYEWHHIQIALDETIADLS